MSNYAAKLMKRIHPGTKYRWLGPKCKQCKGTGVHQTKYQKCPSCGGCGHRGPLAKLFNLWKLDTPLALPSKLLKSTGNEYTWEDWEMDTKKNYPIRFFLQKTFPKYFRRNLLKPINSAYWWFRYRTINRYHIVDISDKKHYYHRGWIDIDQAMLLACFKLFCSFMEKEAKYIDWEDSDECKAAKKEMDELFYWWSIERPEKLKNPSFKDYNELERKDDQMLVRLMKIRRYFWS